MLFDEPLDLTQFTPSPTSQMTAFFVILRAISIKARSAAFTASESGKYSATSGESQTMFVPSGYSLGVLAPHALAEIVLGQHVRVEIT